MNYKMQIGDKAPNFTLEGVDGSYSLSDFKKKLLVVFFSCNHCPYAQAYEKRVNALVEEFSEEVDFVAINSNDEVNYPEDSFEEMKKRAENEMFLFKYLRDETQNVAKEYGGECTPHFFVFDEKRTLQYQGRLDDNWQNPSNVEHTELKVAIVELLEGVPVQIPITNALGCSIKWK